MLQIFYTHYEYQIPEPLLGNLSQCLPNAIVDTGKGLIRWENKQAYILGRLLLLHGLKNYGYKNDCLNQLKVNRYGKPYMDSDIHFNLSHSGNFVVEAFSKTAEVGIDIEKIKKIEILNFKNIFSEKEKLLLEKSVDPQMAFFKIWATKKAL